MLFAAIFDGVICEFSKSYADFLAKVHGRCLLPPDYRTSPDWPPKWDWESHYGYSAEVQQKTWQEHIIGSRNFWMKLQPLPTARESLGVLNALFNKGEIDLFFITSRLGVRVKWQTCQFLYQQGIDFPQVIISHDKVPVLRALGANFFIDDKPETLMNVEAASHAEKWPDFQLYVQDTGYNRSVKVGTRVMNVKEALIAAGLWK